ncbi:alpha-hydroxy acid oxidase [Calidifontibacter terrae]
MNPLARQFRDRAEQLVEPDFWHYVTRGAGSDISVGEAESAWERYRLAPRVLHDVSTVATGTELFGSWRTPIGVAPTAFHRRLHEQGEAATRAGADAAGAPFVLSSRSTVRIEEVAAAGAGPWWFQVYVTQERAVTEGLVRRAAAAGASALVLTADTPYVGHRVVTGPARPVSIDDDLALVNMGEHLIDTQRGDPWAFVDQDPSIGPETLDWLRAICDLPVLVKGVLRPDDAETFVDAGASGIWVSNHGGRQLDRAMPTAAALPDVLAAVGDRVPVVVDGGVRDAGAAMIALALGASAVFLGRPAMWALAAGGSAGVEELLAEFALELGHLMGLAGVTTVADLPASGIVV